MLKPHNYFETYVKLAVHLKSPSLSYTSVVTTVSAVFMTSIKYYKLC